MNGLKFDKTITLGDLCTAVILTAAVVAFGVNLKSNQAADEKQITALVQAQDKFQESLQEEKDARMAYQSDNDKSVIEIRTIINDRLNIKP